MKKKILLFVIFLTFGTVASAEDYSKDIHKNDSLFFYLKAMHGQGMKNPYNQKDDTYMEIEFGGRKGIVDLYGYIDFKNITGNTNDDTYKGDNFFAEIKPRISLDGLFKTDLSIGPIKEWYIAGWLKAGDNAKNSTLGDGGLWHNSIGLGTDIMAPWLGKTSLNVLATYKREDFGSSGQGHWDGYSAQFNWFKPLYFFQNKSFIAYQGYVTYDFGADKVAKTDGRTKDSLQWYNGIYWHSGNSWVIGYGLKYYHHMANFSNDVSYGSDRQDVNGVGNFIDIGYAF